MKILETNSNLRERLDQVRSGFLVTSILFTLSVTGCQNGGGSNAPSMGVVGSGDNPQVPSSELSWKESSYQGRWFQAKLKALDQSVVASKETEASHYSLQERTVGTASQYRFYQIEGASTDKSLFIIPKLLVRSEVFGGRVRVENQYGTTTVRFPVAFVDYSKSKLVTGYSEVPVPPGFTLDSQEKGKLGAELSRAQSGSDCPERIELRQGNDVLPLSISFPEGGCHRNQFFEVVASGKASEIKSWFEEKIPQGNVAIYSVFRPKASIVKEVVSFDINSSLLFERLYATLIEGSPSRDIPSVDSQAWSVSELHEKLRRFLSEGFRDVNFSGLTEGELNSVIDAILGTHFVKSEKACPASPTFCMKLKSRPDAQNLLSFTFTRSKDVVISGNPIEISAPVRDLSQDVELFKVESEKSDDSFAPREGRIGGSLKQLSPGDLVELEVSEITSHQRRYSQAMYREEKSRLDNVVCVSWGEAPTTEVTDYNNCLEYNQECAERITCDAWANRPVEWEFNCCWTCGRENTVCCENRRSRDPNYRGERSRGSCERRGVTLEERYCSQPVDRCARWVSTSCKRYGTRRVPNGPAPCERKENHWMKHYDLADPLPMRDIQEDLSTLDTASLVGGLKLQFTSFMWDQSGEPKFVKMTCSLSNFQPEVKRVQNKLLIRFRVENHPENTCEPFNPMNTVAGFEPEVALVNQISMALPIPCGFVENFWDGRDVYTCPELNQTSDKPILRTYYPRMDIAGKLRLPGVRFMSDAKGVLQ